jgi:hypothetical protein
MKYLLLAMCLLMGCASNRVRQKRVTIDELKDKYRMYGVQNNPYFYFMMDSSGGPHLVRTHMFKSTKVIWIEKLNRQ